MKKITSKKLLNYGAMSAAILGVANASGQIVFTDIDDVTMAPGDDAVNIDLNDDGTIDFQLQNFPGSGAVAFPGENGAANSNGFVGFAAGGFEYPSNLAAGDVIDGAASQTTAGARGDLNFYGCAYSNSQFCNGVVDGYLGLIFQFEGNEHYGWAQVDVAADVSAYTLKSFAFNATPDEAIEAGQETLSLEDNAIEGLTTFVSNNVLTVRANTPIENVTIHNISGQEVVSQRSSDLSTTIDLNNLSTGVYIATVAVEGKLQAIKVVKN